MTIEAKGEFTFRDVLRGSFFHGRMYLLVFSLLGLIFLGIGFYPSPDSDDGWTDRLVPIAGGLTILILPWWLVLFRSYRAFKSSPIIRGQVHYRFDEDGLVFQGPHSQGELKWTGILKWKEDKHTFLLYSYPKMGNTVPKRFFSTPADVDAARELIRSKVHIK